MVRRAAGRLDIESATWRRSSRVPRRALGICLIRLMYAAKLSNDMLARMLSLESGLHISVITVVRWRRGARSMKPDEVDLLCRALRLPADLRYRLHRCAAYDAGYAIAPNEDDDELARLTGIDHRAG